ncbi:unnamed protein product, partial [Sphacelaria rigidula]
GPRVRIGTRHYFRHEETGTFKRQLGFCANSAAVGRWRQCRWQGNEPFDLCARAEEMKEIRPVITGGSIIRKFVSAFGHNNFMLDGVAPRPAFHILSHGGMSAAQVPTIMMIPWESKIIYTM